MITAYEYELLPVLAQHNSDEEIEDEPLELGEEELGEEESEGEEDELI